MALVKAMKAIHIENSRSALVTLGNKKTRPTQVTNSEIYLLSKSWLRRQLNTKPHSLWVFSELPIGPQ